MEVKATFGSLPLELKAKIFSYLDQKSLKRIALVCKAWKEIRDGFFFVDIIIQFRHCVLMGRHLIGFPKNVAGLKKVMKPVPFRGCHVTLGCLHFDESARECRLCFKRKLTPADDTEELLKRSRLPFMLEVYSELSDSAFNFVLDVIHHHALQIARMNIAEACPESIKLLGNLPKLRSLTIFDPMPSLPKLLALKGLPLVALHLFEESQADVLPCTQLLEFLSSTTFTHLHTLDLRKSRINDACTVVLRQNCPKLRTLEVQKATDLSSEDQLTRKGLLNILHLPMLKFIEITFPQHENWLYLRKRWVLHSCDPLQDCPIGIDSLLTEWDDTSSIIVDK